MQREHRKRPLCTPSTNRDGRVSVNVIESGFWYFYFLVKQELNLSGNRDHL